MISYENLWITMREKGITQYKLKKTIILVQPKLPDSNAMRVSAPIPLICFARSSTVRSVISCNFIMMKRIPKLDVAGGVMLLGYTVSVSKTIYRLHTVSTKNHDELSQFVVSVLMSMFPYHFHIACRRFRVEMRRGVRQRGSQRPACLRHRGAHIRLS